MTRELWRLSTFGQVFRAREMRACPTRQPLHYKQVVSVHERQASCTRWPRLHHPRTRRGHSDGLTVWPLPRNFCKTDLRISPTATPKAILIWEDAYADIDGLRYVRRLT